MIKTFRGKLNDEGQDRIRLSTNKGKIGYRITKFNIFPYNPGTFTQESLVMIFKTKITTVPTAGNAITDFSDPDLLAAGLFSQDNAANDKPEDIITIFDREMFNQDIYVTHTDQLAAGLINYYIELEAIDLSDTGAEFYTIRNLRANRSNAG